MTTSWLFVVFVVLTTHWLPCAKALECFSCQWNNKSTAALEAASQLPPADTACIDGTLNATVIVPDDPKYPSSPLTCYKLDEYDNDALVTVARGGGSQESFRVLIQQQLTQMGISEKVVIPTSGCFSASSGSLKGVSDCPLLLPLYSFTPRLGSLFLFPRSLQRKQEMSDNSNCNAHVNSPLTAFQVALTIAQLVLRSALSTVVIAVVPASAHACTACLSLPNSMYC